MQEKKYYFTTNPESCGICKHTRKPDDVQKILAVSYELGNIPIIAQVLNTVDEHIRRAIICSLQYSNESVQIDEQSYIDTT